MGDVSRPMVWMGGGSRMDEEFIQMAIVPAHQIALVSPCFFWNADLYWQNGLK